MHISNTYKITHLESYWKSCQIDMSHDTKLISICRITVVANTIIANSVI